jgi:predicted DNA-binding transcriptional regulator YafY
MPHVKNALIRYRIIDRALRNEHSPYPSKVKLRELCEESLFGSVEGEHICDSTIEKDLFAMRMEHDAPIKYSKKHGGYYYTEPGFTIDDTPLTPDDIAALKFAASTIAQFRNTDFFQEYGFALDRIIDRIEVKQDTGKSPDNEFIQFETGFGKSGQEHISTLLKAIDQKRQVWFDHTGYASEEKKRRKVTPLLLKEYRNRWYLISYDLVKDRISTFGLDRIEAIEVSDEPAKVPVHFNPDTYFKHAVGITVTGDQPVEVQFKCTNLASKYLLSQPLHESQELVREGKKRTTFRLHVLVTEELIRTILSYAAEIEVLEPKVLRDELMKRISEMHERYVQPN